MRAAEFPAPGCYFPMAPSDDSKPRPSKSKETTSPVPKAVVSRLSLYLRELQHLVREGQETTNSGQLGGLLGFTDAQVRKDLAYFGQFGYPGIGYRCDELIKKIRIILGTDEQWPVTLIGVGNLGQALLGYKGFLNQGFRIVAAFDSNPEMIGKTIEGVLVSDLANLSEIVQTHNIKLGLLAVPADAAQSVADKLVAVGIEGILNFAPMTIMLPENVSQVGIDLAIELEQLSFAVLKRPTAD